MHPRSGRLCPPTRPDRPSTHWHATCLSAGRYAARVRRCPEHTIGREEDAGAVADRRTQRLAGDNTGMAGECPTGRTGGHVRGQAPLSAGHLGRSGNDGILGRRPRGGKRLRHVQGHQRRGHGLAVSSATRGQNAGASDDRRGRTVRARPCDALHRDARRLHRRVGVPAAANHRPGAAKIGVIDGQVTGSAASDRRPGARSSPWPPGARPATE